MPYSQNPTLRPSGKAAGLPELSPQEPLAPRDQNFGPGFAVLASFALAFTVAGGVAAFVLG